MMEMYNVYNVRNVVSTDTRIISTSRSGVRAVTFTTMARGKKNFLETIDDFMLAVIAKIHVETDRVLSPADKTHV